MSLDQMFFIGNSLALAGWALLIFVPNWRSVSRIISGVVIPVLLSVAYTGLVMGWWSRAQGGFGSLSDLAALFDIRALLLAGWLHYLAFDMLVGAWEVRAAKRQGMAHWTIIPALLLTFMFGPAGLLVFLGQRTVWRRGRKTEAVMLSIGASPLPNWMRASDLRLLWAGLIMLATLAPTFAAYLFDDRLFGGEAIWLKPMRFEISLGIYMITLAIFYPLAGEAFRTTGLGKFVVWAAIVPSFLEGGYIALQAARGLGSHYNVSTPIYAALYGTMGVTAIALTLAAPALAKGIGRARSGAAHRDAFALAVVIGLILTALLGGIEGIYMSAMPSHFGRVVLGGEGLPLFGWSRITGDLRVSHFFGIHALQAIPIFGLVAAGVLSAPAARVAVFVFTALYIGLVVATFVEAIAGLPILPD
jgi:Domain of unknown function (DUF4281)